MTPSICARFCLPRLCEPKRFFAKLERALEGGGGADLQQLEHAALVRGETNALANDFLHHFAALGQFALALRLLRLPRAESHDVALVQALSNAGLRHDLRPLRPL